MPQAKEVFLNFAGKLVTERQKDLDKKAVLLADFKNSILDPVLDSGRDPETAGTMAQRYSEKRAEIIAKTAMVNNLPDKLREVLDEFGVGSFYLELSSGVSSGESPLPFSASHELPRLFAEMPSHNEGMEQLPEIIINRKAKEVKIGDKSRQFRGEVGWAVFLSIFSKPEGATRKEIEEAAKNAGSNNPEVIPTHIFNLRGIIAKLTKAELIIKVESEEGERYVPRAKIFFAQEESADNPVLSGSPPVGPGASGSAVSLLDGQVGISLNGRDPVTTVDVFVSPRTNPNITVGLFDGQGRREPEEAQKFNYRLTANEHFALLSIISFLCSHGDLQEGGMSGTTGIQILRRFGVSVEGNQKPQMTKELSAINGHGKIDSEELAVHFKNIVEKLKGFVEDRADFMRQNGDKIFVFELFKQFDDYSKLRDAIYTFFDTYAKVRFDPNSIKYTEWQENSTALLPPEVWNAN